MFADSACFQGGFVNDNGYQAIGTGRTAGPKPQRIMNTEHLRRIGNGEPSFSQPEACTLMLQGSVRYRTIKQFCAVYPDRIGNEERSLDQIVVGKI
jgi:hypothetical protein